MQKHAKADPKQILSRSWEDPGKILGRACAMSHTSKKYKPNFPIVEQPQPQALPPPKRNPPESSKPHPSAKREELPNNTHSLELLLAEVP